MADTMHGASEHWRSLTGIAIVAIALVGVVVAYHGTIASLLEAVKVAVMGA